MVARSTKPSVLIADAEPHNCRVFEAKLSKNNQFDVLSVTSGNDALRSAIERPFDVLLWDMRLRETYEVLPRLRALCPMAVLLLMTTDDRPVVTPEVKRLDVAEVLTKPFSLDTLVERIQGALTSPLPGISPARMELAQVGQQVLLQSEAGDCTTRVLETGQDTFTVVAPPRVEAPDHFAPGTRVRVQVHGEDALYSFQSVLLRSLTAPVPRWELQMPRAIRREQRRKSRRHPLHMPVALFPEVTAVVTVQTDNGSATEDENAMAEESLASGITENVSLAGCVLVSERSAPVGAEVTIDLLPANQEKVEGIGKIVRLQPLLSADIYHNRPRYCIAVQFTSLKTRARQRLRTLLETQE